MEFNSIDLLYSVNAIVKIKCMLELFHRIDGETAYGYIVYTKKFYFFLSSL